MIEIRVVSLSRLLFDERNPRLHQPFDDQRAIIEGLLRDEDLGPKIVRLAGDIASWGPSPSELLIVTPEGAPAGQFIVLEGNRRLAALRLLQKPALAEEVLSVHSVKGIRALASSVTAPTLEVRAVVVDTRREAEHWIELRHGGELAGAGTLRWDARATDRWRTRHARAPSFISQVLTLLARLGVMPHGYSAHPGRFPTTTLARLLIGDATRASFGLGQDEDGFLLVLNEPAMVARAFAPIVEDLTSRATTVSDLKRKEQRLQYVRERVPLPPRSSRLQNSIYATGIGASSPQLGGTPDEIVVTRRRKRQLPTKNRRSLIPKKDFLNILQPRINDVYHELQRLDVDLFPNTCGVMFRVFLELSIDDFVARHRLATSATPGSNPARGTLAQKIHLVVAHMKAQQLMTHKELASARRLTQAGAVFDSRVSLLNAYVHNSSMTPKPSELRTEWNDLSEFFRHIWP